MKKKFTLILSSAIVCLMLAASVCVIPVNAQSQGKDTVNLTTIDNGIYDAYTNTDRPNGQHIRSYFENEYAKTVSINKTPNEIGFDFHVTNSDSITKIVPEELFTEINTTFYVGQEYGGRHRKQGDDGR